MNVNNNKVLNALYLNLYLIDFILDKKAMVQIIPSLNYQIIKIIIKIMRNSFTNINEVSFIYLSLNGSTIF